MAYLLFTQCRVASNRMQEFTAQVQHWEQDAMRDPDAPQRHAVYLETGDPSRVIIVAEFESEAQANRFANKGLLQSFQDGVLRCMVDDPGNMVGYDLYYSATPQGPAVAFGESAHLPE